MFNRDKLFGVKDGDGQGGQEAPPGLNSPPTTPEDTVTPLRGEQKAPPLVVGRIPEVLKRVPPPPDGSRLIVGPDIKLKGVEITNCDTLVVEGYVEATMCSRVIHISESGSFSGTVTVDVAEIRGRFDGTIVAKKQLIIYSTGKVSGQISYESIRIEEGGEIGGTVKKMTSNESSA